MTASAPSISVIIPLAPDETEHADLVRALAQSPAILECLTPSEGSRALSLNAGARAARGEILWFLHADSRPAPDAVDALHASFEKAPDALHYFALAFAPDPGIPLIALNAWGANLRSRLFGAPYGDQGLALSRTLFSRLPGFPEDAPYGEDHLFVWRARQRGVRLQRVSSRIVTSPRRYRNEGWLRLTLRYQILWIMQALPEAWALLWGRAR